MKQVFQFARVFLISPEMVVAGLPFLASFYMPSLFNSVAGIMLADLKWSFGIVVVTVAVSVFCLSQVGDILSPKGRREIILDWPDYPALKLTIYVALFQLFISVIYSLVGFVGLVVNKWQLGAAFMFSGVLQASVTSITLFFALWRSRELLRE